MPALTPWPPLDEQAKPEMAQPGAPQDAGEHDRAAPRGPKRRAIVFIHGIFSGHGTFATMHEALSKDAGLANRDVEFLYHDYKFNDPLEDNGAAFAKALRDAFEDADDVVIVSHSMGGLISRLALLSQPLPFVRILLLLGTPNAGAVRASQLGLLSKLMHASGTGFLALFGRVPGIWGLSRAGVILKEHAEKAANTSEIDYVSIPGLLFHADQRVTETLRGWGSTFFSSLDAASQILTGMVPLMAVRLDRPHDGIVEESSNNLILCPSGRWHEKKGSIGSQRGVHPPTYAHVTLPSCGKLNHIQIHQDAEVIEVVAWLAWVAFDADRTAQVEAGAAADPAAPKGRLNRWVASFSQRDRDTIHVDFGP